MNIQFPITNTKNLVLVTHFGEELDSHQADILFGVAAFAQFFQGAFNGVVFGFLEIVEDLCLVVFIENLFDVIVDVDPGA